MKAYLFILFFAVGALAGTLSDWQKSELLSYATQPTYLAAAGCLVTLFAFIGYVNSRQKHVTVVCDDDVILDDGEVIECVVCSPAFVSALPAGSHPCTPYQQVNTTVAPSPSLHSVPDSVRASVVSYSHVSACQDQIEIPVTVPSKEKNILDTGLVHEQGFTYLKAARGSLEDGTRINIHPTNEDNIQSYTDPAGKFTIVVLTDGHDGDVAAKWFTPRLLEQTLALVQTMQKLWPLPSQAGTSTWSEYFASEIKTCFLSLDHEFCTSVVSGGGCTAVVCVMLQGLVLVANAGDCRCAVLSSDTGTKYDVSFTTTDDHPGKASRLRQVLSNGGVLCKSSGKKITVKLGDVTRDMPYLRDAYVLEPSMGRKLNLGASLGDALFKTGYVCVTCGQAYAFDRSLVAGVCYKTCGCGKTESSLLAHTDHIVSPLPDVYCYSLCENDQCIVLASDGLWNFLDPSEGRVDKSNVECTRLVKGHTFTSTTAGEMASVLSQGRTPRPWGADDCTVWYAWLD